MRHWRDTIEKKQTKQNKKNLRIRVHHVKLLAPGSFKGELALEIADKRVHGLLILVLAPKRSWDGDGKNDDDNTGYNDANDDGVAGRGCDGESVRIKIYGCVLE